MFVNHILRILGYKSIDAFFKEKKTKSWMCVSMAFFVADLMAFKKYFHEHHK